MKKRGRPPKGSALVEKFDGSEGAKERLKTVVATLTGEVTVEEACGHLRVSEARFHQMRDEVLQGGLVAMEPKAAGRPPKESESEDAVRVRELEARVKRLELEVKAGYVKTMIALTMPKLLKIPEEEKQAWLDEYKKKLGGAVSGVTESGDRERAGGEEAGERTGGDAGGGEHGTAGDGDVHDGRRGGGPDAE
jgi:hypothetical protein